MPDGLKWAQTAFEIGFEMAGKSRQASTCSGIVMFVAVQVQFVVVPMATSGGREYHFQRD